MPSGGRLAFGLEIFEEFLPEIWKWLYGKFRGDSSSEDEESETRTPWRERLEEKKSETLQGIAAYWALIPSRQQNNLNRALEELPEEEQDACEKAVGEMLKQLTNGIFPASLKKVTREIPHRVKKGGKVVTVWKDRVTEVPHEKPGWDPGKIFIGALTKAGRSQISARRFWRMTLQASPLRRHTQRLVEWFKERDWFSKVLCWITFTRRRVEHVHNGDDGPNAFDAHEETDEEMLARALRRLARFVFVTIVLATLAAFIAIPLLFWKLIFGSTPAGAGIGGMISGLFWIVFALAILSLVAITFLRIWGFEFAWRKYWVVLGFAVAVGLGVRLLSLLVTLGEHSVLAPIAILLIALLAWDGIYRRLTWRTETLKDGDGAKREIVVRPKTLPLVTLASVVLVASVIGMYAQETRYTDIAASVQGGWVASEEILDRAADPTREDEPALFTRDGRPRWCRPEEPGGIDIEKEDSAWWYWYVYRCDPAGPGTSPSLGVPGRALTPEEALLWLPWQREVRRREKEARSATAAIVPTSSTAIDLSAQEHGMTIGSNGLAYTRHLHLQAGEEWTVRPSEFIDGLWVLQYTDPTACVEVTVNNGEATHVDCPGSERMWKAQEELGKDWEANVWTFRAQAVPADLTIRVYQR